MNRELSNWSEIVASTLTIYACIAKGEGIYFRLVKTVEGIWTLTAKALLEHGNNKRMATAFIKKDLRGEMLQILWPATKLAMEFDPLNAEWFVRSGGIGSKYKKLKN